MTEAAVFVLLLISAFAFGYYTGRDRARDNEAFKRACREARGRCDDDILPPDPQETQH